MNILRRSAGVYAKEGFKGLVRRGRWAVRRLLGGPPLRVQHAAVVLAEHEKQLEAARAEHEQKVAVARAEYERQFNKFRTRAMTLGHDSLDQYYWYHTVDLGNGLVTPGDYDYRDQISSFGFPERMDGMRVLDIGSATGYFAFEFERRGAEVTSVELPSLEDWDIVTPEREKMARDLQLHQNAQTRDEAFHYHLDGPFKFCHAALGSKVQRCYSTVYDLTLEKVGGKKFDLVYAGDVLIHLFSPLKALDVIASLCSGSLVMTLDIVSIGEGPLMRFAGYEHGKDGRSWWQINRSCVEHVTKRLGFQSVNVRGQYSGIIRRFWESYSREVIWAAR